MLELIFLRCVAKWGVDSGRDCLQAVVLYGTDRSMPSVWCSSCVKEDAVLFDELSMRDVANVVSGVMDWPGSPSATVFTSGGCTVMRCLGFVVVLRVAKS